MGLLADSRIRRRINKDPNNTKWTRDTTTFGQKILRAQGWQPGEYLGAKDAAHSDLHTAANASYIRVSLKDDMKGLGFSKSKEDVVTGLDVFSDLLSRLNGKSSEVIESEQQARLVMKTNMYVEQKWGPMRFVRGGLLVGDSMEQEKTPEDSSTSISDAENKDDRGDQPSKKEKKSKKRKHADADDRDSEAEAKKEKKRRKEERRAKKAAEEATTETPDEATTSEDAKKSKKRKSKKDKSLSQECLADEVNQSDCEEERRMKKKDRKSKSKDKKRAASTEDDSVEDDKKSKLDKKERKKRRKAEAESAELQTEVTIQDGEMDEPAPLTGVSTPSGSGTGTSTPRGGRNPARSRFLAAKRQAMMDTKALNQIFMIKA